jgi:predicted nucleic acid-binding protein
MTRVLILDSGGVSFLSEPSRVGAARIVSLREVGLWPPLVPSAVLVECLQGHTGRDANTNRFLKTCDILDELPETLARRAAWLRARAKRGGAVDALVVATAEPNGTVLTGDFSDLSALATHSQNVIIHRV